MSRPRIRVLALALIVHPRRPAILVSSGRDPATGAGFERLLGGGVDFGERAAEAVRRELREELGLDIVVDGVAGVLENLFSFAGRPGHEIAFVLEARFVDPAVYDREHLAGIEADPVDGHWRELAAGAALPLYPPGVDRLAARVLSERPAPSS